MTSYSASDLRFHALRNALYHTARRRHLEWWNRIFNLAVILLGTAAAAEIATAATPGPIILGMTTALVGSIQLVFDLGGRARTHEILQKRYFGLLAQLEENPEPNMQEIAKLNGELVRIYGDEPPVAQIDEALAYNEAADALGADPSERMVVPNWMRFVAKIFPLLRFNLRTISENRQILEARKKGAP